MVTVALFVMVNGRLWSEKFMVCTLAVTGRRNNRSVLVIVTVAPDRLIVVAANVAGKLMTFAPGKFFRSAAEPATRVMVLTSAVPYTVAKVSAGVV